MIFNFLGDKVLDQTARSQDILNLNAKETALLVTLFVFSNSNNHINKSEAAAQYNVCNRTWNKYWNKLAEEDFIIKVPGVPKVWMIDPNIVSVKTADREFLIKKWNALHAQSK